MIDPKLLINGTAIAVGASVEGLKQAGFDKNGFISRWGPLTKARRSGIPCDAVYTAINPRIDLFGDPDARLVALNTQATESEDCYGTFAQAYSYRGSVTAVHLILIRSSAHGLRLKRAVRRWALRELGPGTRSPIKEMPRLKGDHVRKPGFEYMLWADAVSYLLFRGVTASRSCYIFWEGRTVPRQVAALCPQRLENIGDILGEHELAAAVGAAQGFTDNPRAGV